MPNAPQPPKSITLNPARGPAPLRRVGTPANTRKVQLVGEGVGQAQGPKGGGGGAITLQHCLSRGAWVSMAHCLTRPVPLHMPQLWRFQCTHILHRGTMNTCKWCPPHLALSRMPRPPMHAFMHTTLPGASSPAESHAHTHAQHPAQQRARAAAFVMPAPPPSNHSAPRMLRSAPAAVANRG